MTTPRRPHGIGGTPEQLPRSGEVLLLDRSASVQFSREIRFRVIRVLDWPTYRGWVWIDGYQLDERGDAVVRRSLFVQLAGLRRVTEPTSPEAGDSGHVRYRPERHRPAPLPR